MSDMQTLELASINVGDSNPRTELNADTLEELRKSIEKHGVLQPVVVHETGDGIYELIAGQRRYRAAELAGLTDIPAVIRTGVNGTGRSLALVENMQREQLSPIEEARAFQAAIDDGMSHGELTTALSVSGELVRDRLALLDLPEQVQERVHAGVVPLKTAKVLGGIAAHSPAIASAVVTALDDDNSEIRSADLDNDLGYAIEQALDTSEGAEIFALDAYSYSIRLDDDFEGEQLAGLEALRKQLPESRYDSFFSGKRGHPLSIDDTDRDAARAYGCLLEPNHEGGARYAWITDPEWAADRLKQKLEAAIAAYAKTKKTTAATKDEGNTGTAADSQRTERAKRQKEQAAMLAARERNVELGIKLFKELHAPEPTLETMQIVAGVLVEYAGEDLARRGLRYTDEESQTVTTRKDGTISRVTHLKATVETRDLLTKRLAGCTTPQQIFGVLLQAIAAAHFADVGAAPTSDRYGRVRGLDGYQVSGLAVDELAEKTLAPYAPASVLEARAPKKTTKRNTATASAAKRR